MTNQADRGLAFRALHERREPFLIPNPWDAGSARMLAHLGFAALATTSMGYAFSSGHPDHAVGRPEMMRHIAELAAATDLPVSADLENGYGDSCETVAETIRLAARAGAAGGSIEDDTGRAGDPIYEKEEAADRIRAAAEAARSLSFPFVLTARAENYLHGRHDLRDTVARLQSYQEAGADVLYAPGLATTEEIAAVITSVDRPVNVVMGLKGVQLSVAELAELGVRRISVGSALYRTAISAFLRAAREMREQGTFEFARSAAGPGEIAAIMAAGS